MPFVTSGTCRSLPVVNGTGSGLKTLGFSSVTFEQIV